MEAKVGAVSRSKECRWWFWRRYLVDRWLDTFARNVTLRSTPVDTVYNVHVQLWSVIEVPLKNLGYLLLVKLDAQCT